jgi:hypothetical protein
LTAATLTLCAGMVLPLRMPSQHGHTQVCKYFSHDILSRRGLYLKHPLHNRNREQNFSVRETLLVDKENESQWDIYIKNLNGTKSKTLYAQVFMWQLCSCTVCMCTRSDTKKKKETVPVTLSI